MVPDFEYFIRMNVKGIYGHTFWGLFYFDIPVALLIAVEVLLLLFIRDNLTLNIIMLIHPMDWLKTWQAGG